MSGLLKKVPLPTIPRRYCLLIFSNFITVSYIMKDKRQKVYIELAEVKR